MLSAFGVQSRIQVDASRCDNDGVLNLERLETIECRVEGPELVEYSLLVAFLRVVIG